MRRFTYFLNKVATKVSYIGCRWETRLIAPVVFLLLCAPTSTCEAQNLFFGGIGRAGNPQTADYLLTSDLDGNGLTNILPVPGAPIGVDVDPHIRRVFWQDALPYSGTNPSYSEIRSASLTGTSPAGVATIPGYSTYGLAVDSVNKRVYWAEGTTIMGSDYNGGNSGPVATNVVPRAIEVDPAAGKIFFADHGGIWNSPNVGEVNLNGTGQRVLANYPVGINNAYPGGITVDPVSQTIFFSDYSNGTVSTVPYAGGVPTTLYSGLPEPAGLDLELTTNRLYIVHKSGTVRWGSPVGIPLTTVFTVTHPTYYGEMWDIAAIIPDPEPVTLSGLRNFDVVSPNDVNDFHITLKGISDPRVAANGGTQILGTFPAPFNTPNPNPPGWYPPTITSSGNMTTVSYGGPGAQFVPSQKMHFGVSLTAMGEADLDTICMHWTRDGMPLAEADVNIPITIVTDQAAPGETDIQIVNQNCPDDPVGPPRWLGPIHLSVVERHANLDELVAASTIIEEASVFYDGNTFLAPGEQFTLTDFDAAAPIAPGQSVVVWYDVFADNGGAPGALVGTSYSAFNVAAVPEPTSVGLLVAVAIALAGNGQRCLSKRPRACP